jgi:integrase
VRYGWDCFVAFALRLSVASRMNAPRNDTCGGVFMGRGAARSPEAHFSMPVKTMPWHNFRRTFAGNLLDAGVDLVTMQRLMGHVSPTTTSNYDRRGEEVKRQATKNLHVPYRQRQRLI